MVIGINGVTGDQQFNRHLDLGYTDEARGYQENGIFYLASRVHDPAGFNVAGGGRASDLMVARLNVDSFDGVDLLGG